MNHHIPRRNRVAGGSPPSLRGLLVLNGLLLAALGAIVFGSSVRAQQRVRGDYTMVAGGANGAAASVLHIVDAANLDLVSVSYDPNTKQIKGIGCRNMAADAVTVGGTSR